ncbi:Similar to Retrovirus-related Pol polyprotein from transposon TNT 1-94 (Nicotiana tabacum) [Cotesia congregata]|uniref:Similar to Retrovirus-related Pol polyprotein from transposon TNT 1-94 (Nicotiana tabacum) n=1 Tax=Cotesia congregata TaxID=51543 RepID=A0A8J2H5F4_COTCN|nr:Similar to Retrovirus-related Pol polyprotein from transposon TNT 1-94 (Nicotiana tabacum) [Cotesia congregata]CAG5073815.1 Similar to Retrovirus-related Pol polyprotein from transposon TNT 1-94 (Nicotiana tabacum) [Cotesia congregata]CAG5073817.1 Similar to Retrovirus-related Pol polyprotein from transposon TNT 1-94 (Nicotiana tabacum) [Cotesia congregata]
MAEKDTVNLIKLDGTNYQMWKFGITFLLDSKDLSDFVDGTVEEPDKVTKLADWKMWRKNRSQAAVILLSSVDQALHPNLINCSSPQGIWDKLKALYGEVSEDAAASAWQQYYDFKIVDSEPVNVQIEKFESICKKLENAGEKVSEKSVMSNLLSSLTPRFSAFRMAWECTAKDAQKIENLTVRIIREDKRLKGDEESETTLAFQVNAMRLKKQDRQEAAKRIQELKKRTRCNKCKKLGHWMRECPENLEDDRKYAGKNDEDLKTIETYVCETSALHSEISLKERDIWIADSGASMHIAWERGIFTTLQPSKEITFVKIADNKVLHTAGIGTVDIQVNLNGYNGESSNYRLWDKESRKIHVSSDFIFNEKQEVKGIENNENKYQTFDLSPVTSERTETDDQQHEEGSSTEE